MQAFDRFAELWNDYLEGELDEHGMEQLRESLDAHPEFRTVAIEQYQTHRALGLVARQDSDAFVRSILQRVPASSEDFVAEVVAQVSARREASKFSNLKKPSFRANWATAAVLVLVASLLLFLTFLWRYEKTGLALSNVARTSVKFTNTARTKFLGAFAPAIGQEAIVNHEYILTSGSVQMLFPKGAEVIVQGPAVFQITNETSLKVTVGRCSVYCPQGAEGFVVYTPNAQVVDRGTRFFVNVVESSATEVHVVDGVADVFQSESKQTDDKVTSERIRLRKHEARMIESDQSIAARSTDFRSNLYQYQLPDRIISYQGTYEDGGIKDLTSIDVQRDGQVRKFAVEELIRSRLSWFRNERKIVDMRHLAGNSELPADRSEVMSDAALNTGAINPGGSIEPFRGDPLLPGSDGNIQDTTPGFAVSFFQPVINRPGPDVVFFELQSISGAPDGDPFHVLPLKLTGDRHAITVKSYDLSLTSPEVQRPANFYLHEFERPVGSIEELLTADCRVMTRPQGSAGYRVIAVTIDLSSMGFEEGDQVTGLFFQDALDDPNHVDPVAIYGLP